MNSLNPPPLNEHSDAVILTISVELQEGGEVAEIAIRRGDDPRQLANDFAERHGIESEQLRELLAE